MMHQELALLHWMPVEMYPPAMNMARHLARNGWKVQVYTTRNSFGLQDFKFRGVTIHRASNPSGQSTLKRASAYLTYHIGAAYRLLAARPQAIVYFEPQSSFPAYVVNCLSPDIPIFIHHHEYHEPQQFRDPGMRLASIFHRLEKRLLERATWVSHTNAARLSLFLRDNPGVPAGIARVLPNMPPANWLTSPNRAWVEAPPPPLRLVYVGSLSKSDTYIEAMTNWVLSQPQDSATLDIFSYNVDAETRVFLESLNGDVIRFHVDGVAYDNLPEVLKDFHTGLILYRGNTTNYRHNASNKLFEYLACGLDVLFSSSMEGVKPFVRGDVLPRVIEADFTELDNLSMGLLRDRSDLPKRSFIQSAETVLEPLVSEISSAIARRGKGSSDGRTSFS